MTGEHIICFDYEIVQHKAMTIEDYSSLFATIRYSGFTDTLQKDIK